MGYSDVKGDAPLHPQHGQHELRLVPLRRGVDHLKLLRIKLRARALVEQVHRRDARRVRVVARAAETVHHAHGDRSALSITAHG